LSLDLLALAQFGAVVCVAGAWCVMQSRASEGGVASELQLILVISGVHAGVGRCQSHSAADDRWTRAYLR